VSRQAEPEPSQENGLMLSGTADAPCCAARGHRVLGEG